MQTVEHHAATDRERSAPDPAERHFLSRKSAAEYVVAKWGRPCSPAFLAKVAVKGNGPAYRKINGRWVVYEEAALDAWCASQLGELVTSTSAAAANAEAGQ